MLKKFTLKNCLFGIILLFLQTSFAQKTIQGTVLDETGTAVMGANVWISGTNIGTSTLLDGSYQLEIPASYFDVDLETSFLGFQKIKIPINLDEWDSNNKKELVLKGKDTMLEEVVVTSLQIIKKRRSRGCGGYTYPDNIIRCSNADNCNQDKEKTDKAIIQIFPNPFVAFLKVQIDVEEEQDYFFQLFGIDGKFIFAERHTLKIGKEVVRLDVPNLPVGSYVLRIEHKGKVIQSDILIKASTL